MKNEVLNIVKAAMGGVEDNLYRATSAFKNMTNNDLDEQHGQSGQTRRQIVDGYKAQKDKLNLCIEWVNDK
jgi:hypothetical protein